MRTKWGEIHKGSTNRTSGTSTTAGPSPSPLGSANSSIFCLCLDVIGIDDRGKKNKSLRA
ncbi:hypothetical protein JHK87_052367 [Glycine soja]|nr:hypothetical protein JHK87_052367 [Glycine soja]